MKTVFIKFNISGFYLYEAYKTTMLLFSVTYVFKEAKLNQKKLIEDRAFLSKIKVAFNVK